MPGHAGSFIKPGADALEDAIWSARRDTETGYGIGVFDLDPGRPAAKPRSLSATITPREPTARQPEYELYETVVLAKDRRS